LPRRFNMTPSPADNALFVLPPDINDEYWPRIRLKSLRMTNFLKHKDVKIDFFPDDFLMNCLVGKNGTGKTTILNAVQLLFSNFSGYEPERLRALSLKNVRNYMSLTPEEAEKADFCVEGVFIVSDGTEYTVTVKRDGFHSRHPDCILENLQYYCYSASFDRELHLFQLKRDRWPKFKELMEAVTGYTIEEDEQTFGLDSDPKFKRIMRDYVIAFKMDKGREIIGHRQCSAGERKIIRTFSALLNRPVTPSIIIIDNVTDHVEAARHISVIDALENTFDNSQIIVTCHSSSIQRYLPNPSRLLDMRLLNSENESTRQIWRLRLTDELDDLLLRLSSFEAENDKEEFLKASLIGRGVGLLSLIKMDSSPSEEIYTELKIFAKDVFDATLRFSYGEDLIRMHGG